MLRAAAVDASLVSDSKVLYHGPLSRTGEPVRSAARRARTALSDSQKRYGELSGEYRVAKELENVATGNNPRRLVFEQYVLAGYFEEILRAANLRLRRMTADRYALSRARDISDARRRDNLEIEVMDYYTGRRRSVKTLSGGESFQAALSLALGMSDVIQARSGGVRVEALFIDEGFGALDAQALDCACDTLHSLARSDCLIGIISHVEDLRERIPGQILVERGRNGSTVRVIGA